MIDRRTFLSRLGLAGSAIALAGATVAVAAPGDAGATASALLPADADAELFRLQREYRKARAASAKALKAESEAEESHYAGLPPRPVRPSLLPNWTPEQREQFMGLTIAQLRDAPVSLFGDCDSAERAWQVESDKWDRINRASRRRHGLAAAEREVRRTSNAQDRIARRILRTRAKTVDGMLAKIRLDADVQFNDGLFQRELAKDLRALRRAGAGFAGGIVA